MELHRMTETGLVQLESDQLDDESAVEDWLSRKPGLTIGDTDVFVIHQQGRTREGQRYDLIGLDRKGETVTIELKHARSPRKMVAQAFEYASDHHQWKQPYDTLEHRYQDYTGSTESLREAHADYFSLENPRPETAFNSDQRIILFAGRFSDRVLSVARYLQDKGHEIQCVKYSIYSGDGVRMLATQNVLEDTDAGSDRSSTRGKISGRSPDPSNRIPTYRRIFDRIQSEVVRELGTGEINDPADILLRSIEDLNELALISQNPNISFDHLDTENGDEPFVFSYRVVPAKGELSIRTERRHDPVAEEIMESYRDEVRSDFEYTGNIHSTIVKETDIDHVVSKIDWDNTNSQEIAEILLADETVNQYIEEYVEMIHRWHPRIVKEYSEYLEKYVAEEAVEQD
jgi:hypothetical protein